MPVRASVSLSLNEMLLTVEKVSSMGMKNSCWLVLRVHDPADPDTPAATVPVEEHWPSSLHTMRSQHVRVPFNVRQVSGKEWGCRQGVIDS